MRLLFSTLLLVPSVWAVASPPCLVNWSHSINGCDTTDSEAAVVAHLDTLLADEGCAHDGATELEIITNGVGLADVCKEAWSLVDTSTFDEIDKRFNNGFMAEYVAGDTFLNTETGSFQGTEEGNNIDAFRDDLATSTVLQGFAPLANCEQQSIMCCFGRDRQPNDDNGNCAEPLDTNCIDADPADNSNLCYTEHNLEFYSDPFAFPGKSEGPIHCHGLAWGDDENDFISQLKYNNFFYVSLYDHMYTRGYVETTVDSDNIPMCACVEDMPKVSRADCTEIDATLEFTISYNNGNLEASSDGETLAVEFNACNGINPGNGNAQNNDLASYVNRLNQDGKLSDTTRDTIYQTLVGYEQPGNNENEAQCEEAYREEFGEDYPENVQSLKCPNNDPTRLFRTEDTNPLTLEECQWLCYDTDGCQYFSIGTSPGNDNHKGVCIGCTADAALETHKGFNAYEMTGMGPTSAPTNKPDEYDVVGDDIKCPHDGARLFRTVDNAPLTTMECYEKCYETAGCEYFTLGVDPANAGHTGVCMGCIEGSNFQAHSGFKVFSMAVTQDFGSDNGEYDLVGTNKKCPSNRLFRTPDNNPLTLDECFEKCVGTPGCEYFTLGEGANLARASWQGVCMGCAGDAALGTHNGFNTYEIAP